MRDCYPLPKVPATRTPQLDSIMKPEASAATKAADKQLAKVQTVQTLLLDSLAPMTSLLESHHRGDTLNQKEVIQAVRSTVELIGNANANMSHGRELLATLIKPSYQLSETIPTSKELIDQDNWLTKVDLKDAYFAIPIHRSHHQYLRFIFQDSSNASHSAYHCRDTNIAISREIQYQSREIQYQS